MLITLWLFSSKWPLQVLDHLHANYTCCNYFVSVTTHYLDIYILLCILCLGTASKRDSEWIKMSSHSAGTINQSRSWPFTVHAHTFTSLLWFWGWITFQPDWFSFSSTINKHQSHLRQDHLLTGSGSYRRRLYRLIHHAFITFYTFICAKGRGFGFTTHRLIKHRAIV